jgi:6,7-dimethyl-8-ribityllumazine synthase
VRPSAASTPALPPAGGFRFCIITSRFNEEITHALREGARDTLLEAGAAEAALEFFDAPGAFELPQAARCAAETGRFDAIICLGCVIRGETAHFEYISSAAANGLMAAAGETGVPMAFGVLTTDTIEQAQARSVPGPDNKGREAAAAAIEMATMFRKLGRPAAKAASSNSGLGFGSRS